MKLNVIALNQTEIVLPDATVFFSYNTPVAARIKDLYLVTNKTWSNTTTRHINTWLDGKPYTKMTQEFFDNLLSAQLNEELV